jgi:ABC-type dipeptide/oligopeptide/nickel transport system permease component
MPAGSPLSGSPVARRAFSRPPISVALVGLVTLLTAATGATLGALAWREKHTGSRALLDTPWRRPRA